jgi:hypothetical protein
MATIRNKTTGQIMNVPEDVAQAIKVTTPYLTKIGPIAFTKPEKVTQKEQEQEFGQFAKKELFKKKLEEGKSVSEALAKEKGLKEQKMEDLNKTIDFVGKQWEKINAGTGTVGRSVGIGRSLLEPLQLTPDVSAYKKFITGIRPKLSRGLGDVGNLSEQEQKAAMDLLPTDTDNYETGMKKLQLFKEYINYMGARQKTQPIQNDPLGVL